MVELIENNDIKDIKWIYMKIENKIILERILN